MVYETAAAALAADLAGAVRGAKELASLPEAVKLSGNPATTVDGHPAIYCAPSRGMGQPHWFCSVTRVTADGLDGLGRDQAQGQRDDAAVIANKYAG